jgi:serine protease AprX
MDRVLKVLATGAEQAELAREFRVREPYEAFVLLEAPASALETLRGRGYVVEDITDLYTIPGNQGDIDTSLPRRTEEDERDHPAYERARRLSKGPHHYLVQFRGPTKPEWLAGVEAVHAEPREPYSNFTFVVRADAATISRVAGLDYVRWVGHLRDVDRIAPTVHKLLDDKAEAVEREEALPGRYTVEFFSPENLTAALGAVRKSGFDIVAAEPEAKLLVVQARPDDQPSIDDLAAVHGVREIRRRTLGRLDNDVAARIMEVTAAVQNAGPALSGKGEYVGVCDSGLDTGNRTTIHRDFAGRVAFIKSYPIASEFDGDVNNPGADKGPADQGSGHGTHVAGSILGNGAESKGVIRGLAPKARLVFQAV